MELCFKFQDTEVGRTLDDERSMQFNEVFASKATKEAERVAYCNA